MGNKIVAFTYYFTLKCRFFMKKAYANMNLLSIMCLYKKLKLKKRPVLKFNILYFKIAKSRIASEGLAMGGCGSGK